MKPQPPRLRRSAFTLVELLVVIAIVAIMAAILFPVLNSARGAARAAINISNLHQIALAGQAYANDNKGRLVPLCTGTSLTGFTSWQTYLAPYLGFTSAPTAGDLGCLASPQDLARFPASQRTASGSYGLNKTSNVHEYNVTTYSNGVSSTNNNGAANNTYAVILHPSQLIMVCDVALVSNAGARPSTTWIDSRTTLNSGLGYARFPSDASFVGGDAWDIFPLHGSKACVAFYDGRAAEVDVDRDILAKPSNNPLFLNE